MPRADYWRDLAKTAPSLSPNKSSLSYDLEHIVRTFHSEELYPCLESRTTDQRYPQEPPDLNVPGPNRTRLKQLQGRVNRLGGHCSVELSCLKNASFHFTVFIVLSLMQAF